MFVLHIVQPIYMHTIHKHSDTNATTTNATTNPAKPNYRDYANRERSDRKEGMEKRQWKEQFAHKEHKVSRNWNQTQLIRLKEVGTVFPQLNKKKHRGEEKKKKKGSRL